MLGLVVGRHQQLTMLGFLSSLFKAYEVVDSRHLDMRGDVISLSAPPMSSCTALLNDRGLQRANQLSVQMLHRTIISDRGLFAPEPDCRYDARTG